MTTASTGPADSSRKPSDVTHSHTEHESNLDNDEDSIDEKDGVHSEGSEEEFKEGTP